MVTRLFLLLESLELLPGKLGYLAGFIDKEDTEVVLFAELPGKALCYFGSVVFNSFIKTSSLTGTFMRAWILPYYPLSVSR